MSNSFKLNNVVYTDATFPTFFDPRVNRMWDTTWKSAHIIPLLTDLYSDYNLQNCPYLFWPNMKGYTESEEHFYNAWLKDIPEGDRWALHFFGELHVSGERLRGYKFLPNASTNWIVRSTNFYLNTNSESIAYRSNEFPAVVTAMAASWKARLDAFNFDAQGKAWSTYHSFPNDCTFFMSLKLFLGKQLTYGETAFTEVTTIPMTDYTVSVETGRGSPLTGVSFNVTGNELISSTNRRALYKLHPYSTNPCKMLKWPIIEKGEHKPVLYGVELECSFNYSFKDMIDAAHIPFFIAKQDSSISGSKSNLAELVTIPMSLKAHKRHWAHWFKKLDYSAFDTTTNTSNGMHVHIDRTAFDDDKHVRNMTWFYNNPANTPFIVHVSERGSLEKMRSYTPIIDFGSGVSKIKAYKQVVQYAKNYRGAVNFGKPATVEVRIFRGIVSFAELVKNLEFVDAVFHFTRSETNLHQLSLPYFIKWLLNTSPNKYQVLKKFIDQTKHLESMIKSAEVTDLVFNEKDPEKIAIVVNRSRLTIDNALVTMLNKGRKRTYVLDKETGKIKVTLLNKSKLAHLDRDIEARFTRNAFAA